MRFRLPLSFIVVAAATFVLSRPATAQPACIGDCNGDGAVTVDEVITMVNIALGTAEVGACPAGDGDSSGDITVDEIVTGVTNALEGCAGEIDPTPTPTQEVTPEPTATPTATIPEGSMGRRRFVIDPSQSNIIAVLGPGFEIPIGSFRGQKNGVIGDAYFEMEADEPDENGLALIHITDSSDYIIAQAAIANLTICLQPLVPVASAGAIQCDGGLDYSIETSIDRVAGKVGVAGFTVEDCTAIGGTIEGPNQVCGEGRTGIECFLNEECDTAPGAGDGVCGLFSGTCPGFGLLGGGAPCNTNADCDGGATCSPIRCTEGRVGETCRNAGDCDTTPQDEDGACGPQADNPGGCQGPLTINQIGEDSGPGSIIIAPIEAQGVVLNGLPLRLGFESGLPCGDEGGGAAINQAFALTTGTARTVIHNYNATTDDLVLERKGQNLSCENWVNGTGGRFGLSFPAVNAGSAAGLGGDLILGFIFQGR